MRGIVSAYDGRTQITNNLREDLLPLILRPVASITLIEMSNPLGGPLLINFKMD